MEHAKNTTKSLTGCGRKQYRCNLLWYNDLRQVSGQKIMEIAKLIAALIVFVAYCVFLPKENEEYT